MLEKFFLAILSLYIIVISFLKKRFIKFNRLFLNKSRNLKFLSKEQSFRSLKYANFWAKVFSIDSCFTKTLAHRYLLNLGEQPSHVFIGVYEKNNEVHSHCWLKSGEFYTDKPSQNANLKIIRVYK